AGGSGQTATLTFTALNRSAGATVNFTAGAGQTLGTTNGKIVFSTTAPALTGSGTGIIKGAVVTDAAAGGFNLATYTAGGVSAVTSYQSLSTATNGNNANDNVLVTSSTAVGATDTVNAVLIRGNNVTLSGGALTVGSGVVAFSGTGNAVSASSLPL